MYRSNYVNQRHRARSCIFETAPND